VTSQKPCHRVEERISSLERDPEKTIWNSISCKVSFQKTKRKREISQTNKNWGNLLPVVLPKDKKITSQRKKVIEVRSTD
jgi:hypothetical protein